MNEYRLKITVRNNLLLSAIEQAGYKNQSEFARSAGLSAGQVNDLTGLRAAPIGINGEFSHAAKMIMEELGAAPSDLWTDKQLFMELDRNTAERPVSELFVSELFNDHLDQMTLPSPEDVLADKENKDVVNRYLDILTEREKKIMHSRFFQDSTYENSGKVFGVTKERIRQIEKRALTKIRRAAKKESGPMGQLNQRMNGGTKQ